SFNDSMRVLIAEPPVRRAQTRRGATTCPVTSGRPRQCNRARPCYVRRPAPHTADDGAFVGPDLHDLAESSGVTTDVDERLICSRGILLVVVLISSRQTGREETGGGGHEHMPPPPSRWSTRAPKSCAGPGAAASPPPLRAILSTRPYASRLNESRCP